MRFFSFCSIFNKSVRFQGVLMYYRCVSFCLAQRLCDERVSTKKQ